MPQRILLPSTASSKDPAGYPMFRGQITRGVWRLYTQRLTPAGRWMMLVSAILIGYGGSSLQIQAYILASYLIFVWIVALLAAILLRPKVALDVQMPYRVAAGDTLTAKIQVRQRRFVHGGDLSVAPFNLPPYIDSIPADGVAISDLRRSREASSTLQLRFKQRGLQHLKGFRVTSSFPFGIIRSRQTVRLSKSVLVYPSFAPLEQIALPQGGGQDSAADLVASRLGESFEFLGNREYREGDNPRDINWRATARMPQPIVREWIEERQVRVSIFLDDAVAKPTPLRQQENFERAVSLTAAVSEMLLRQGTAIRQVVVGQVAELEGSSHRPPDLQSVLDLLALVKTTSTRPSLPAAIRFAAERGDVIVLILLSYEEARQQMVRELLELTPAVKTVVCHEVNMAVPSAASDRFFHLTPEMFAQGVGSV